MRKVIGKAITYIAHKEAENNVNSLCLYWHHQPHIPEEVMRLKKNKWKRNRFRKPW